jgi:hypothetical protein
MTGDTNTGLWLLCGCFTVPFALGVLCGWALRGRVFALGWPWAVLPGFVKSLVYKILEYGGDQ